MRAIAAYIILLLTFSTTAQTIKLNFEPQGMIIKFYFDSLTIYTDTTALFRVYKDEGDIKDYDLRVKNLVRRQIRENKTDTVLFSEEWYIDWAILQLTKAGKIKMCDKHGQLVKIIVAKKVGKKKNNYVKRSYINKATNEELLKEILFIRIYDPVF